MLVFKIKYFLKLYKYEGVEMSSLQRIAIWYVLVRAFLDVIGLMIPGVRKLLVKWGWPINEFWMKTVWPLTVVMCATTARLLVIGATRLEEAYVYMMVVIPIYWSYVLVEEALKSRRDGKRKPMLIADSISWLLVVFSMATFL
ncbi:hypothetical protein ACFL15_00310 [Patescibacteria group bacterium]